MEHERSISAEDAVKLFNLAAGFLFMAVQQHLFIL